MKKFGIILGISLLMLSLASAIYTGEATSDSGQKQTKSAEPMLMQTENAGTGYQIKAGENIVTDNGQLVQFRQGEGEQLRIQSGEHVAECSETCNLTQSQNRIQATLSNGRKSEIKVMPDTASEKALERLRLKSCENCTLELKEVGEGNEARMAYEIKTQKKAKVLGIFGAKMKVQAQVDAETGEVIQSKKSWWSFMASESDEEAE